MSFRYVFGLLTMVALGLVACTPAATPTPTPSPTPTRGAPLPPLMLEARVVHDALMIQLVWLDYSDNETAFIVERSEEGEAGPWRELASLPPGTTSYLDIGLKDKQTYWYRVKARNAAGDSPYSNVASGTASDLPRPTATPTPTPDPWRLVAEGTWQDKVRMTMWVTLITLRPGQALGVLVRVENISSQTVEYTVWNIGDPPVYTSLQLPFGGSIPLRAPGDPQIVQPAVSYKTVEPGQSIEREVRWDGTIPTSAGTPVQAPNGTYTAIAVFYPDRQIGDASPRLELTHQVQVAGSTDLTSPQEARQNALTHPSVQRWLEAHTGRAVAREEKGNYFVNLTGKWEAASRELYDQVRKETSELPEPVLESPGNWRISFASKYGFPPHELTVQVIGATGQIAKVDPDVVAELHQGVVATFDVEGFIFRAYVTNRQTIEELYRLQRGERTQGIPNGLLRPGPGPGLHNTPWSWHLDPADTHLADLTVEVCDGTPDMVEADLDYWLNTVERYCPWGARLVGLEDYRPETTY